MLQAYLGDWAKRGFDGFQEFHKVSQRHVKSRLPTEMMAVIVHHDDVIRILTSGGKFPPQISGAWAGKRGDSTGMSLHPVDSVSLKDRDVLANSHMSHAWSTCVPASIKTRIGPRHFNLRVQNRPNSQVTMEVVSTPHALEINFDHLPLDAPPMLRIRDSFGGAMSWMCSRPRSVCNSDCRSALQLTLNWFDVLRT